MARILMAWEHGSGFGHVKMLMPLAEILQASGHTVTLALRDTQITSAVTHGKGLEILQAPLLKIQSPVRSGDLHTIADIFCSAGFADEQALSMLSGSWQSILDKVKPDLVILEMSPTLALLTLGRIPTITLGSGYSTPPSGMALPNIRPWDKELRPGSEANEQKLRDVVNAVRRKTGLPDLDFLADLFGGEQQFVCTYPVLDMYGHSRKNKALGPIDPGHYMVRATATPAGPPQIILYLNADLIEPEQIIRGVRAAKIHCEGYIRGLKESERVKLSGKNIYLQKAPLAIPGVLEDSVLCIHHGGTGTAEWCLRYGIPQIILPNHLEQLVNGAAIRGLGMGELLRRNQLTDSKYLHNLVETIVHGSEVREISRDFGAVFAAAFRNSPLDAIENACNRLLAQVG